MADRRRVLWLLPALLVACGRREPPAAYAPRRPEGYAWLTPLRLNVRDVAVESAPAGPATRFDRPGDLVPAAEVERMARDRLQPVGTAGRARFAVDSATLAREDLPRGGLFGPGASERLTCALRCRVEVFGEDGRRVAFAEAEARRAASLPAGDRPVATRNATEIVAQAMEDLNVEFEVQVRRNLRDWLLDTSPSLPPADDPGGIRREELGSTRREEPGGPGGAYLGDSAGGDLPRG